MGVGVPDLLPKLLPELEGEVAEDEGTMEPLAVGAAEAVSLRWRVCQ